MEKQVNKILTQFKNGDISLDKTRRLLLTLTGVLKTSTCTMDRLESECSISLHTKSGCNGCRWYVD